MTLLKRASASEIGCEVCWIDGYGVDWLAIAASWILIGIVVCGILIRLMLLRRKSGRVTEMVDDETQTLEEGRNDQTIRAKL